MRGKKHPFKQDRYRPPDLRKKDIINLYKKGARLMFRRSWVRLPAPYTGRTYFSQMFVAKLFVRNDEKKGRKEAGDGSFSKTETGTKKLK